MTGSTRTYMLIHRLYYWKDLKASVNKHIKTVYDVPKEKHTSSKICSTALFYPKAANAIYSMDVIGLSDPFNNGYHYALRVICMLTGYMFCIPLKAKTVSKVVKAHIDGYMPNFGDP